MERDGIIASLTKYFAARSDVVVAYLFGSAARDRRLHDSDIDVGILFAENADAADGSAGRDADKNATIATDCLFRRVDMAQALQELLSDSVDVVDLGLTPPHFNHHVLRHKVIIKGHDASERIAFEKSVRRQYFDMLPYHRRYEDASLRRLREGGGAGGRRGSSEGTLAAARRIHQRLRQRSGH